MLPQRREDAEKNLFGSRPALFHQREQMFQRILVAAVLFGGQLFRALVKLRGHVGGFFRRAAEGNEDLGEFGNFHG